MPSPTSSTMPTAVADPDPLVVRPREASRMLAIGNTRLYELLGAGELESYLDGRARRITMESIRGYVARRLAVAGGTPASRPAARPPRRGRRKQDGAS